MSYEMVQAQSAAMHLAFQVVGVHMGFLMQLICFHWGFYADLNCSSALSALEGASLRPLGSTHLQVVVHHVSCRCEVLMQQMLLFLLVLLKSGGRLKIISRAQLTLHPNWVASGPVVQACTIL